MLVFYFHVEKSNVLMLKMSRGYDTAFTTFEFNIRFVDIENTRDRDTVRQWPMLVLRSYPSKKPL